jgi:hypothetical protein
MTGRARHAGIAGQPRVVEQPAAETHARRGGRFLQRASWMSAPSGAAGNGTIGFAASQDGGGAVFCAGVAAQAAPARMIQKGVPAEACGTRQCHARTLQCHEISNILQWPVPSVARGEPIPSRRVSFPEMLRQRTSSAGCVAALFSAILVAGRHRTGTIEGRIPCSRRNCPPPQQKTTVRAGRLRCCLRGAKHSRPALQHAIPRT